MPKDQLPIEFHTDYPANLNLESIEATAINLIRAIIETEQVQLENLSIIWVTDAYLVELHNDYLDDPTETDIMTFNYAEAGYIDAELYISIDRAKEQAPQFKTTFENELLRLVIHGVLHMSGFDDLTESDRTKMRAREDYYLKQA
jgi:rRNA maturation RNase YbeY